MRKIFLLAALILAAHVANAQTLGQSWFYGGASGGGGGGSTISNQTTDSIPANTNGTANALNAVVCTPPSVNGIYNVLYNITGSAIAQPTCPLNGLIPDQAAGATVLYSDANNVIYNPAASLALPTPTTLGNANFFTTFINNGSASTITPATWTISLNGGSAGSTAVVGASTKCSLVIDQSASTQWDLDCVPIATGVTGTGSAVRATSPTLVTPALGAATATSLLATGIVDGVAPITITTGTSGNLGATYLHGYTFNQEGTAGTGVTYTLPATAVGKQYCVANSGTTGVVNTGVLTVYPPSSSYVIYNGTVNTVGGGGTHGIASGGAAGDGACFVAIDATHWQVYVQSGTWTLN